MFEWREVGKYIIIMAKFEPANKNNMTKKAKRAKVEHRDTDRVSQGTNLLSGLM